MKNIIKSTGVIAISTLAIGLFMGWLIFGGTNPSDNTDHNHDSVQNDETIWTCSMHPQIRQNEPGDCPLCGMDLIPLEEENQEIDPRAVSMSATAMQLARVQTMVVGTENAQKSINLNGKVQADERLLFTQSSHIPGRIEKLTVNFTGEYIREGQVIAYIYSPELVTAQEELFEARKIKDTQPRLFQAAKEKLRSWKLTEQQIDQIAASEDAIEQFPILANVSGYVTEKMVNLGDYINRGDVLYEIADLSRVWILFDVYESDMTWIRKGDQVSFSVQSIPGKTFVSKIGYIDPVIDPKTRVAKARVELVNEELLLKPEMFASGTVNAQIAIPKNSITVPKTAVMWTGKRSVVYVMKTSEQGVNFLMREVTLGPATESGYMIESGLHSGEEIAVHGTFSIDAAAQLAGKPSMMNPEGSGRSSGDDHSGSQTVNEDSNSSNTVKISLSKNAQQSLIPLFDGYFEMKNALVEDDLEKAKKAGVEMKTALTAIRMEDFKGDAHEVWMKQFSVLTENFKNIQNMTDIAEIRQKFMFISNAFIVLANSFDPLQTTVYIQYCPMADSNTGADWLSREKEIRNPYFGASMLMCGEVVKTIP